MIEQSLYPKTKRICDKSSRICINEKLDGSNLGFFKWDGHLWVAQRNRIFRLDELEHCTYRGLKGFLEYRGEKLQAELHENACVFGEWLGMGQISYPEEMARFQQFCKCNVDINEHDEFIVKRKYYNHGLFKWSYTSQVQPEFIGTVPNVTIVDKMPSVEALDELYDFYCTKVERKVEGFVINNQDVISKYVRLKNGKPSAHKS